MPMSCRKSLLSPTVWGCTVEESHLAHAGTELPWHTIYTGIELYLHTIHEHLRKRKKIMFRKLNGSGSFPVVGHYCFSAVWFDHDGV